MKDTKTNIIKQLQGNESEHYKVTIVKLNI